MKIGINCGHTTSGAGYGASGYIKESVETRNVGKALMQLLKNAGHTVVDCTVDTAATQNAYLSKTVQIANAQALDLFVSIHFNAGGGKGCEVFTYKGAKITQAVNACNKLNALGFTNRGVKDGSNLYVVNSTKATAMLVEVCFVDTKADSDLYNKVGYSKVAQALFEAITGTTYKAPVITTPTKEDNEMVETINMTVNGQEIKTDAIVKDNITYVKLRGLEAAGFEVGFNAETKLRTLDNKLNRLPVIVEDDKFFVNAVNINGYNYVSIREICAALGASLDYDKGTVILNK